MSGYSRARSDASSLKRISLFNISALTESSLSMAIIAAAAALGCIGVVIAP
jgi:hypothetical protein